MNIVPIDKSKRDKVIKLILNVFMEFEAPDYSAQGIEAFKETAIYNNEFMDNLSYYGAFERDELVGVIATRNKGNHIAFFFVKSEYQKRGIGRQLFNCVLENSTEHIISVNSSPYAVPVYHKLGFVDTDVEQLLQGIRFTPMSYTKKTDSN